MEHVDNTVVDVHIHPWLTEEKRKQGETWRELEHMDAMDAEVMKDIIHRDLYNLIYKDRGTYKVKKPKFATLCKDDRTLILFDKGEEETVNAKEYLELFCKQVINTGLMFVDTEGSDQKMWKGIGCRQDNTLYHVALVQFGTIKGQRILIRTLYDCRKAHKEGKRMTEQEHEDAHEINGVPIPQCLINLLKDEWVYKIQSNITGPANSPGNAQKLGRMLGIRVKSLIELQNLFFLRYGRCSKSGMDALCTKMGLHTGTDILYEEYKRRSWTTPRGDPKKKWTARMYYYDLVDVMVPAMFCLDLAVKLHSKEPAASSKGGVLEHLRLVLHLLRDEPSFTRSGSRRPFPWFIEKPFVEYDNDDLYYRDQDDAIKWRAIFPFPWRPGMVVTNTNYGLGPAPVRNLRQLAGLIIDDAYKLKAIKMVKKSMRPTDKRSPTEIAKEVHAFENPVTTPDFEYFAKEPYDRTDRFRTVNILHEQREYRAKGSNEAGPQEQAAGPSRYLGKRAAGGSDGPPSKKKKDEQRDYTTVRHPFVYGRCMKCGDDVCHYKGHKSADCREKVWCKYPLCTSDRRTHSTLVCFDLMQKCPACGIRGHPPQAHRTHSLVMLITVFLKWSPFNVLTSLPYLHGTDHHRIPTDKEYRFMYHCRSKGLGLHDKY